MKFASAIPFMLAKESEMCQRLKRLSRRKQADNDDEIASLQFLLLAAMHLLDSAEQKCFVLRDLLTLEGMWRRDRRIPRACLVEPGASPWEKLYSANNDQAMITVTGFDCRAFAMLLMIFDPFFRGYSPWTGSQDGTTYKRITPRNISNEGGRPRKITATSCLGLVLSWYRFKGAEFILQGWFGFTGTPASVWIRFGRRMLLAGLAKHPWAKVVMPTDEKVQQYQAIIAAKHPTLREVYCVADGLKLAFEGCHGLDEQSMYYNGWTHGHYVTNLFVFGPDGRIINCVLNAPGSIHDSTLAEWGNVYDTLEAVYNRTGGICCLDSAFASNEADYLIRSSENLTKAKDAAEVMRLKEATSLRQAAEWGMHAIQSAFPRLKDTIKFERNGERKIILKLAVLLYNYRVEAVGLNQIRNVYVREWSRDAEYIMNGV